MSMLWRGASNCIMWRRFYLLLWVFHQRRLDANAVMSVLYVDKSVDQRTNVDATQYV